MGVVSYLGDGLRNLVSNLGTGRDKSSGNEYTLPIQDDAQYIAAYRGSWLPRKIIDIPAFDACRKWRKWNASADQITLIEKVESRLNVREKVREAITAARLYGGAAILIGNGDADPMEPLDIERMGKGSIKYLTVISRRKLSAGNVELDVASEWYGKPKSWSLTNESGQLLSVHPSRLVLFIGASLPTDDPTAQIGWGDSVLASVFDSIKQADATTANIASLVFEAKIDVISVPNLQQNLSHDPSYESVMIKRFQLAAIGKGINGTLILDSEETYTQKSASFATLPDIMDRFYQCVSGAADIPMTRLFGRSPSGMNATGDADLRNYYDRIQAIQTLEIAPAMYRLDECIIRDALGTRPPEIFFEWSSLWQVSEKEQAEIGKLTADTIEVLMKSKLYTPEAIAEAGANAMVENGSMPGLESAIGKFGPLVADDIDDDESGVIIPVDDGWKQRVLDAQKPTEKPTETIADSFERIARSMPAPVVNVDVKPSNVNVEPSPITINTPAVTVEPAQITVNLPETKVEQASVTVNVPEQRPAIVNVDVHVPKPQGMETEVTEFDDKGRIKRTRQTPIKEG